MNFSDKVLLARINRKSVSVFSLGQAGFIIKLPSGKLIAVDLYLSDCCERAFGFKRLMPKILSPSELEFDYILCTHAHYDHFDIDSMAVMAAPEKTKLIAAKDVKEEAEKLNLEAAKITYLSVGEKYENDEFSVKAVECDHGELAPEAVGFLIKVLNKKIYIMGDTAFRPDYFANKMFAGCDLLILPINGAFGNLNEKEAAEVINTVKPKVAVPCHFWNFAEHGGNPLIFMEAMKEKAPEQNYYLMQMGEELKI